MNRHSILIIDDEVNLLKSLEALLKDEFHIHTAQGGREGLMILGKHPVSMVLLDLGMPDMNGIEVLEEIRKEASNIKVIIMTGGKDYERTRRCADLGVNGFIEKPVHSKELLLRINSILGRERWKIIQSILGEDFEKKTAVLSPLFIEALSYIEKNAHKGIFRNDVSDHLKLSPDYFSKLFIEECSMNFNEFLNRYRIEKSLKHLSKIPFMKIKDVAESVGISDMNYFCRLFKKHKGITPSGFQKNRHMQASEDHT